MSSAGGGGDKPKIQTIGERVASLGRRVSNIRMGQARFHNGFRRMDRLVIDAGHGFVHWKDPKNIFKVAKTRELTVHDWRGKGEQWVGDFADICFNHYCLPFDGPWHGEVLRPIDNIPPDLKARVRENARGYLRADAAVGRPYTF